jgi:two-component system, LytTR family, sensor kinase
MASEILYTQLGRDFGFVFQGRSKKNFRIFIHVLFWITIFFTFFFLTGKVKETGEAFLRSAVNTFFMVLIFYSTRLLYYRFYETKNIRRWLQFTVVLFFISVIGRTQVEFYFFKTSIFSSKAIFDLPGQFSSFIVLYFLATGFVLIALSSYYHIGKGRRELDQKLSKMHLRHLEAQLNLLKFQLNPHFLFNSLNSIYASAILGNRNTPEMILKLSDILRFLSYTTKQDKILLKDEITQVENYLELFKLKTSYSERIGFKVIGKLDEVSIIPMLLLPFVENALKHGNFNDDDSSKAMLKIEVSVVENLLTIKVGNTYHPGAKKNDVGGEGTANLVQRLELGYPEKYYLQERNDAGFYEVILTIDLR